MQLYQDAQTRMLYSPVGFVGGGQFHEFAIYRVPRTGKNKRPVPTGRTVIDLDLFSPFTLPQFVRPSKTKTKAVRTKATKTTVSAKVATAPQPIAKAKQSAEDLALLDRAAKLTYRGHTLHSAAKHCGITTLALSRHLRGLA